MRTVSPEEFDAIVSGKLTTEGQDLNRQMDAAIAVDAKPSAVPSAAKISEQDFDALVSQRQPKSPMRTRVEDRMKMRDRAALQLDYLGRNGNPDDPLDEDGATLADLRKALSGENFIRADEESAGGVAGYIDELYQARQKSRPWYKAGADSFRSGRRQAAAMAINAVVGALPPTESRMEFLKAVNQNAEKVSISKYPRKVGRIEDIHGIGDALTFGLESFGENAMRTATMLGTAYIGGLAGMPVLGGMLSSLPMSYGEAVGDQVGEGLELNRGLAAGQGAGYALLDALGGAEISAARRMTMGIAKDAAKRAAMQEAKKAFTVTAGKALRNVLGDIGKEALTEPLQSQVIGRGRRYLQTGSGFQGDEGWSGVASETFNEAAGAVAASILTAGFGAGVQYRHDKRTLQAAESHLRPMLQSPEVAKLNPYDRVLLANTILARVSQGGVETSEKDVAATAERWRGAWMAGREAADMTEAQREAYADENFTEEAVAAKLAGMKAKNAELIENADATMAPEAKTLRDNYLSLFSDASMSNIPAEIESAFNAESAMKNRKAVPDPDGRPTGQYVLRDDDSGIAFRVYEDGSTVVGNDDNGMKMPIGEPNVFTVAEYGTPEAAQAAALKFANELSRYNQWRAQNNEKKAAYVSALAAELYPGSNVVVYDSLQGIPDEGVRAKVAGSNAQDGFFDKGTGTIYINADAIQSPAQIAVTMAHEQFHADFQEFLAQNGIDERAFFGTKPKDGSDEAKTAEKGKQVALEERMARAREQMRADPDAWVRVTDGIRAWFRQRLGIGSMSDRDIDVLFQKIGAARRGGEGRVDNRLGAAGESFFDAIPDVPDAPDGPDGGAPVAAVKPEVVAPVGENPDSKTSRTSARDARRQSLIDSMESNEDAPGEVYDVPAPADAIPAQGAQPPASGTRGGEARQGEDFDAREIISDVDSAERLKKRYPMEWLDALDATEGNIEDATGLLREWAPNLERNRVSEKRAIAKKIDSKSNLSQDDVAILESEGIKGTDLYDVGYRRQKASGEWRYVSETPAPQAAPEAQEASPAAAAPVTPPEAAGAAAEPAAQPVEAPSAERQPPPAPAKPVAKPKPVAPAKKAPVAKPVAPDKPVPPAKPTFAEEKARRDAELEEKRRVAALEKAKKREAARIARIERQRAGEPKRKATGAAARQQRISLKTYLEAVGEGVSPLLETFGNKGVVRKPSKNDIEGGAGAFWDAFNNLSGSDQAILTGAWLAKRDPESALDSANENNGESNKQYEKTPDGFAQLLSDYLAEVDAYQKWKAKQLEGGGSSEMIDEEVAAFNSIVAALDLDPAKMKIEGRMIDGIDAAEWIFSNKEAAELARLRKWADADVAEYAEDYDAMADDRDASLVDPMTLKVGDSWVARGVLWRVVGVRENGVVIAETDDPSVSGDDSVLYIEPNDDFYADTPESINRSPDANRDQPEGEPGVPAQGAGVGAGNGDVGGAGGGAGAAVAGVPGADARGADGEQGAGAAPAAPAEPVAPALNLEAVSPEQLQAEAKRAADRKALEDRGARPISGGKPIDTSYVLPGMEGAADLFNQPAPVAPAAPTPPAAPDMAPEDADLIAKLKAKRPRNIRMRESGTDGIRFSESGIDPETILLGGQVANNFFARGGRKFDDFADYMLKQLGDDYKAYLTSWYGNAKMDHPEIANELDNEEVAERAYSKRFGTDVPRTDAAGSVGGQRPDARVSRRSLVPVPGDHVRPDRFSNASGFTLDYHQTVGVNLMLDGMLRPKPFAFLLADGTGFGKTAQLLAVAAVYKERNPKARILIVTQNKQIAETRFGHDAKRMGIPRSTFEIETYSSLAKMAQKEWDLILFDESHNLKNADAKKSMAAARLRAPHKVFATATPMDRPTGAAYFLSEITGEDEYTVAQKLGYSLQVRVDPYTQETFMTPVLLPNMTWHRVWKNVSAYRDAAIESGNMIRREYPFFGTADEMTVPMTRQAAQNQESIANHFDDLIASTNNPRTKRNYAGQRTLTLSRLTEQSKVDKSVELALEHIASGGQVVIVAETSNEQSFPAYVHGGVPGADARGRDVWRLPGAITRLRNALRVAGVNDVSDIHNPSKNDIFEQVEKFQSGVNRVALATPQSGGTGIDLDDTSGDRPRLMIVLSKNFSGDAFEQLVGRVSRKNTASPARVLFLQLEESISDARRDEVLSNKLNTLKAIQGGTEADVAAGFNAPVAGEIRNRESGADGISFQLDRAGSQRYNTTRELATAQEVPDEVSRHVEAVRRQMAKKFDLGATAPSLRLVEPVYDSEAMAVRRVEQAAREEIERIFRKRIVFVDGGTAFHALIDRRASGLILLNARSNIPSMQLIGHEISHAIDIDDKSLYDAMAKELSPILFGTNRTKEDVRAYLGDDASQVDIDDYAREMFADAMGHNFADARFWDLVAERNPSLFKRLADYIVKWIDGVMSKWKGPTVDATPFYSDMKKVRSVLADTLVKYADDIRARASGAVTPEQDAAYLAAVEAGDTATAQRMVDAAAKAAGYNVGPVWHGSKATGFTVFDPDKRGAASDSREAWFFAETADMADQFAWQNGQKLTNTTKSYYLRMHDANIVADHVLTSQNQQLAAEALRRARRDGKDGVAWERADVLGKQGFAYGVFDGNNIKSADPVTRDDTGRVVPLSERFNAADADIRFSESGEDAEEMVEPDIRFRRIEDGATINQLESGRKIKAFAAMQLVDGRLVSPMAAKINGQWTSPAELGAWYATDENPGIAFQKNGRWYFALNKGNGKTVPARYNPYFHSSLSPLNDQFTSASNRPNLVTVEVELSADDLESGYKADKAKDGVGERAWKSGPVARKLPKSKARRVFLSRYRKIIRVVPDGEVAESIAKLLNGENIAVPENVVTPSLKAELVKRGVPVGDGAIRFKLSGLTEADADGSPAPTSIKDAVMQRGRDLRGVERLDAPEPESMQQWADEASAMIEADPDLPSRLVEKLASDARNLSDQETAVLQLHRRRLVSAYETAAERMFALAGSNDVAARKSAYETVQHYEAQLDALDQATKAAGTEWGRAGVARQMMIAEDFSLAAVVRKARIAKGGDPLTEAELNDLKKMVDDLKEQNRILGEDNDALRAENEAVRERMREIIGRRKDRTTEELYRDSTERAGASKRENGGAIADGDLKRIVEDMATAILTEDPRIATDAFNTELHKRVQAIVGDITPSDVMRAFTGYGKSSTPNQEEVAKAKREKRAIDLVLMKLESVNAGQAPEATGPRRDPPPQEAREKLRELNALMKELGIVATDPEGQLKTAMDAVKTRLRNQIEDIEKAMRTGRRMPKNDSTLVYDDVAKSLVERRDALKQAYDELFPPAPITEEQRVQRAIKIAERTLANLNEKADRYRVGNFAKPAKADAPSDPRLDAIRTQQDAVRAEIERLKDEADPKLTPEELAVRNYQRNTERIINHYNERAAAGDFAPKARKEPDLRNPVIYAAWKAREAAKALFRAKLNAWRLKHAGVYGKIMGHVVTPTMDFAREMKSAFDLSAVGRQGGWLVAGNPKAAAKAVAKMFSVIRHDRDAILAYRQIDTRANAPLYSRAKLYLVDPSADNLLKKEEMFQSRWAELIPGVKMSKRTYITFLNQMRVEAFDAMVDSMRATGEPTTEDLRAIASYVNTATGRGDFGRLAGGAEIAATVLWSPRLQLSRIQLLTASPLRKATAKTRGIIAAQYLRSIGGIVATIALARLFTEGDDDEEEDLPWYMRPINSKWATVRQGDTRFDFTAGLASYVTLATRILTGEKLTNAGVRTVLRGEGQTFGGSVLGEVGHFARKKFSPVAGAIANVTEGRTIIGEPATAKTTVRDLFMPLSPVETLEIWQEHGIPSGAFLASLAILGVGAQTYGSDEFKEASAVYSNAAGALRKAETAGERIALRERYPFLSRGGAIDDVRSSIRKTDKRIAQVKANGGDVADLQERREALEARMVELVSPTSDAAAERRIATINRSLKLARSGSEYARKLEAERARLMAR